MQLVSYRADRQITQSSADNFSDGSIGNAGQPRTTRNNIQRRRTQSNKAHSWVQLFICSLHSVAALSSTRQSSDTLPTCQWLIGKVRSRNDIKTVLTKRHWHTNEWRRKVCRRLLPTSDTQYKHGKDWRHIYIIINNNNNNDNNNNNNKLCGRPPQYAPAPYKLTFWPWKRCPSHVWLGLPLCQF